MTFLTWVGVVLAVWFVLAVVVGLIVGQTLRRADGAEGDG